MRNFRHMEATNVEWTVAKIKIKSGQVVVWLAPRRHCETRAKVMSFSEFQTSVNKVDPTRTVSSSEAAR